jgi:glycine cleavage system aminomethyltransferase T/electron transfer flavoprotein alpha/beta subunit
MDVKHGKVVYTPVLTPRGGFRSDLTVMRIADDHFRVVTGGAHGMADFKWYRDHAGPGAEVIDLTSSWCTLGLWGPRARDVLQSTTGADVSHEAFPFASFRTIELGSLPVLASRISYVGDLGWELYVPIEQGARLWDTIWEAGEPHGVVPAGIGVYATTGRLEKCYRAFGFELDGEYNVAEAGMAWGKVKEQDFVGKEAHVRHREEEPATVMCTLTVDDHTSKSGPRRYMLGGEPIVTRDGAPLIDSKGRRSFVTSAGAGPSVGKHLRARGDVHERAVPGHGRGGGLDAAVRSGQRARQGREPGAGVRILVCVKRVPLTGGRMVLTADEQALETRHLGFTISPHEECGVEEAVRIAEQQGGEVTVLTLGPPEAEEQIRETLAIGADRGILLATDGEEWDAQATAAVIAQQASDYDLVIFGNESADSGNYQVGVRVAYALGRPVVTGLKGLTIADGRARCEQEVSGGRDVYEVPLPAVVTVLEGINLPRYPSVPAKLRARQKPVETVPVERPAPKLERLRLVVPEGQGKQAEVLGEGPGAAPAVVEVMRELGVA